MGVLLGLLIAAIVLVIAFGPIVRQRRPPFALDVESFSDRSGRLDFRHPSIEDLSAIEALYLDPELRSVNHWDDATLEEALHTLHDPRTFRVFAWTALVAVRRRDDTVVGMANLSTESGSGRSGFAIGIQLLPEHRGQGLGTELLAAMITATRAMTDGEIWVGTALNNHAMHHMMANLGYTPQADVGSYTAPDGTAVESYWYQVGGSVPPPAYDPSR